MFYIVKSKNLNGVFISEEEKDKAISLAENAQTIVCSTIDDIGKYYLNCGKFYAVKRGKSIGIFFDWDSCKSQTSGVKNTLFKSFYKIEDALEYIMPNSEEKLLVTKMSMNTEDTFAYVDGSFNKVTNTYGYGVILMNGSERLEFSGSGNDTEMAIMRNVAGEILGAQRAIAEAIKIGAKEITVYYDYQGIASWAKGEWKRNKRYTIEYYNFVQEAQNKIKIIFQKVKAHSGVELNEQVDKLAKTAVGL